MYKQPISQVFGSVPIRMDGGEENPTPPPPPPPDDPEADPTPRPWPTDPDKDEEAAPRPWPTDPDKDEEAAPRPWPTDPDQKEESASRQIGDSRSSGKVYALLIGIDEYKKPGANLKGCVRDSKEVESYLRENVDGAQESLHLYCLRSPESSADPDHPVASETHALATRENIVAGFTEFLTQAGPGDTVIIHYAGHGSNEKRPKELWHLDPEENSEHRGETIICMDSYTPDNGVLVAPVRDQEIRWMISRIAANEPHIVVIMDCCNSSGNTRDFDPEVTVRYTSSEQKAARPGIESFVFYQKDEQAKKTLATDSTKFTIPQGRHVAMYACHSYELAKETNFPEGRFGAFTYYTLQSLRATRGRVSYRDLIKLVRAKTAAKVSFQSPQYFSPVPEDVDQYFLGGSAAKDQNSYTATPGDQPGKGTIDAGSLHGIRPVEEGTTQLVLFPPDTDLQTAKPSEGLLATVTAVEAQRSHIELADGADFQEGVSYYKAVVTGEPLPATKVRVVAEIDEALVDNDQDDKLATGIKLIEAAIEQNPFIQLTDGIADSQFTVFVYRYEDQDKFRIAERDKTAALVQPKTGLTEANANKLVDELGHIARWERTLHLDNPHNVIIEPNDLQLIAIDGDGNEIKKHSGEIILKYKAGEKKPRLKFKVNAKDPKVPLYCDLIHIKSDFGISPGLLPPDTHLGHISFQEGRRRTERDIKEVYAGSHVMVRGKTDPLGLYLSFSLPEGKDEDTDHFMLLASTEQFDPMHLWQAPLERASSHRGGDEPKVKSPLDALMRKVATRSASFDTGEEEDEAPAKLTDWWTTTIAIKTVRES
jgi:hypothetical protein